MEVSLLSTSPRVELCGVPILQAAWGAAHLLGCCAAPDNDIHQGQSKLAAFAATRTNPQRHNHATASHGWLTVWMFLLSGDLLPLLSTSLAISSLDYHPLPLQGSGPRL